MRDSLDRRKKKKKGEGGKKLKWISPKCVTSKYDVLEWNLIVYYNKHMVKTREIINKLIQATFW